MTDDEDYFPVLEYFYTKSLVLHDSRKIHPVLYFYFIDALAHIDYTLGVLTYPHHSVKNLFAIEYLRWRIDEEKKGDKVLFREFVTWMNVTRPERFRRLPTLWQLIYTTTDPAEYRSFRIVLDPDVPRSPSPSFFYIAIDEFFDAEFLKSIYLDASLGTLFEMFKREYTSVI
jgi:hypothetical protein